MGKTQIVVPGGGGGGGATTGRISVNSPISTIATSSTDFFDFFGGGPVSSSQENPYTLPFPGSVKKVIIRSVSQGQTMNNGLIEIQQQVASVGGLTGLGDLGPLTASAALQEFAVDFPFAAGDGLLFSVRNAAVGAKFLITLEIEYALV